VEILRDSRLVMLPVTRAEIQATLLSLRGAPLLRGVRGRAEADFDAIVEAALGLCAVARDLGDLIAEVDINPLIVLPDGAWAVDGLIVKRKA
jgi:hypothetical protein